MYYQRIKIFCPAIHFCLSVFLLWIAAAAALQAQQLTQTVRGRVIDQDSRTPLPGANLVIADIEPLLGTSSDINGEFRLENVPVGRITLVISYLGYEDRIIPNILVTSGKEIVLDLTLREALTTMDEIVITGGKDKSQVANEMALVSARGFTVEETKRYAGSFNDPARMVAGYAGVTTDPSGDNSIIVRGNSPKGIQWRLEGIEIPNPNHFSEEGATGGAINALNSKMLADSEFYTGAFPAEYGNALAGVFDMKLRKGNNEQREYSFTLGALGTELNSEGPFRKGGGSSYLVNYRYSTLSLLDNLGLVDYGGVPKYQDGSFKVYVPAGSFGTLTVFGLAGKSNIIEEQFDEENEDKLLHKGDYQAHMGVTGITHFFSLNSKTYLQNTIAVSQNGSGYLGYEPDTRQELTQVEDMRLNKSSIKGATTLHHKFNARHNLQAGLRYTRHHFDFYYQDYDEEKAAFVTTQDINGSAGHYQGFVSWKFRPLQQLFLTGGVHAHGLTLNDELSIEPRAGLRWQFLPGQAVTAGFGIHGKMESLPNYYSIISKNGTASMPNKAIELSKARHYVLGYENRLTPNLFLKLEAYYQELYNIPVENNINSSYSLINQTEGFTDRKLANEGTGENVGLELTLERYFADNYYLLATASLYDSKYKAMDGIERDTRFNGNYVGNLLFGKEFELNSKGENKKVIGINTKISLSGGRRYTPVNLERSIAAGHTIYNEDLAFSRNGDDLFIANLAITYRIDSRKVSQELKLDIQNVSNQSATISQYYNEYTGEVEYRKQLAILPVVMYTIHF